jgi:hypothetical protein
MTRLLAAALSLGAALAATAASGEWKPFTVTLEPTRFHEECLRIEAGEKRRYHWKSDAPVDFNIHYHRDKEVFYPVKSVGMRGDGGTFAAKTGEDYCLMWTARDKAAKIEGRLETK